MFTPIILGQFLRIPTGDYTIGQEDAWVGFFGNYSGGIIGGIVAYIIASKELRNAKQDKEKNKLKEKELIFDIINLFLKDEIDKNIRILINNKYFHQYLEENDRPFQLSHNWKFDVTHFEEIKFDIVKYKENPLIIETISLYKVFMVMNRTKDINELSQKQYEDLKKNYYFWSGWVDETEIVFN